MPIVRKKIKKLSQKEKEKIIEIEKIENHPTKRLLKRIKRQAFYCVPCKLYSVTEDLKALFTRCSTCRRRIKGPELHEH